MKGADAAVQLQWVVQLQWEQ
eukprot:COSAG06_NODE_3822_length_4873_cov_1.814202_1_plen_20_part_10